MNRDELNRRTFVRNTGLGALSFQLAGVATLLTPRAACAAGLPFTHLSTAQATLLEQFADHLLPGAAAAGVAHFVDHQLGVAPNECLLMCKYFPEIRAPFTAFYHAGLDALAALLDERSFAMHSAAAKDALTESLWSASVSPWTGPPPPLFYMMVRSDAVDVVYGTKEGFDELNVPYMAHIMPREKW